MRYERTFTYGEDTNTGENGWLPDWLRGVEEPYAMIGNGTAHDVLEHEGDETDGDLETECRALGAVYFVRGESGWFASQGRMNPDPEHHIAGDFHELYRAFAYNGDRLGDESVDNHADPHGMRELMLDIVDRGLEGVRAEVSHDDEETEALEEFEGARLWLAWLLVDGYTKAHERFDGDEWKARRMFEEIASATESAAAEAEGIGGHLMVEVDTSAGAFRVEYHQAEPMVWGEL